MGIKFIAIILSMKPIIISGPSGVGKSSIVAAVLEREPNLRMPTAYTTRPQRAGEVDCNLFYFVPKNMINNCLIYKNKFLKFKKKKNYIKKKSYIN